MYCLTDICFLCLKNNINVQSVLIQDIDGIVVNEKLRCFFPDIIDSTPDAHKLSCSECLEKLRISYDFKQSVIRNNSVFRDYIEKLQCQHESHQQLTHSKHQTNLSVTSDFTTIKVESDEKHDSNSLTIENDNLNLTSTKQEMNLQIENIEIGNPLIEEIYIKEEPFIEDISTNYLYEDSKEFEDNLYECQICHLLFSSQIYLENHTSRCSKIIKISDNIVPKKIVGNTVLNHNDRSTSIFSNSEHNDKPKQKRAKQRLYKCSECHKIFTRSSNLERHRRIHSGEKPFQCQTCQKKFTQIDDLHRHKFTHTGEKPHQCDMCNKSFSRKNNLITHKKSHNNLT